MIGRRDEGKRRRGKGGRERGVFKEKVIQGGKEDGGEIRPGKIWAKGMTIRI